MRISWLVFYSLSVLLIITLYTNDVEIIKEITALTTNLISGYLGYLVRQLEN
jgi:hypothetical protein